MGIPFTTRPPTGDERKAAVRLASKLQRVTYPTRARTKRFSMDPPGKVYMKGLLEYTAQIQQRRMVTAKPFIQMKKGPATKTPIKVGIMCDVSGSMGSAQEPLGVARWVLSEAIHMVNGSVAAALFGTDGHPIQAPHERVRNIEIYEAYGSHENYMQGFRLIDSALDLIDGDGARLLVIITDGHFVLEEAVDYAEVTMDMCRRAGVAVVWMSVSSDYFARPDAYGHGHVLNAYGKTPVQVADMLGEEVVQQFQKVTQGNLLSIV